MNKSFIILIFLLSCFLCGLITWHLGDKPISMSDMLDNYSESCQTSSISNHKIFKVYVPSANDAKHALEHMCNNTSLAKYYAEIKIFWGERVMDYIDFFANGNMDLILTNDTIVEAMLVEFEYPYKPIVSYTRYSAFFISNTDKPNVTSEYFKNKKIGLLEHTTSLAGHILPLETFKALDLEPSSLNILYSSSHKVLREYLQAGKVDVIASNWPENQAEKLPDKYMYPISNSIYQSKWYLKEHANDELACAMQKTITRLASVQKVTLAGHINQIWPCTHIFNTYLNEIKAIE